MIPWALGGLLGYAAILGAGFVLGWEWLPEASSRELTQWSLMFVLAALAQALSGDVVARLMRKRAFDPRVGLRLAPFVLGIIASTGAVSATAVALPLLPQDFPDAIVFATGAALSGAACVLFLRRARPGHCLHCNYDLASSGNPPRCPECGKSSRIDPAPRPSTAPATHPSRSEPAQSPVQAGA